MVALPSKETLVLALLVKDITFPTFAAVVALSAVVAFTALSAVVALLP